MLDVGEYAMAPASHPRPHRPSSTPRLIHTAPHPHRTSSTPRLIHTAPHSHRPSSTPHLIHTAGLAQVCQERWAAVLVLARRLVVVLPGQERRRDQLDGAPRCLPGWLCEPLE